MRKKQKQPWYCTRCKRDGVAEYRAGEGRFSIVLLMGQDHKRVSPSCTKKAEDLMACSKAAAREAGVA